MRRSRAASVLAITTVLATGALPIAAAAGPVVVRQADIDAGRPWAVSPDSTGVAEIGALADPVHSNGSAHLKVGPGQRAQLVRSVTGQLSTLANQPMRYDLYVDGTDSTPSAVPFGANLQLEVASPTFTTLSYQPQLNGGVTANTWQTFTETASSKWRTSRAIGSIPAGSDATLKQLLAAEGGQATVRASYLSVGRLGDTAATLDTYVDNVSVAGHTYDFAVNGEPQAEVEAPRTAEPGESFPVTLSFTSPSGGVDIPRAEARVVFSGVSGLNAQTVTISHSTGHSSRSRTRSLEDSSFSTVLPVTDGALTPGQTTTSAFTVELAHSVGTGTLRIRGELLNDGVPTTITAQAKVDLDTRTAPPSPPSDHHHGHRPGGPELAQTGGTDLAETAGLLGAGLLSLGLLARLVTRRPRRRY